MVQTEIGGSREEETYATVHTPRKDSDRTRKTKFREDRSRFSGNQGGSTIGGREEEKKRKGKAVFRSFGIIRMIVPGRRRGECADEKSTCS